MIRITRIALLSLSLWITVRNALAGEATTLDPVVVEGSSADALLFDPIVSTKSGKIAPTNASGSVVREFEEQLPVPVTDYGNPGTTTQLRGLGRTVEDTNVQTLGVPLNPVVGGGFDFSTFPQFFWSNYSFHLGPSTGGFDPRASSGTVSLTPWTADALRGRQKTNRFRLTEMVTRGLNQFSVAGRYDQVAALVGVSSINAKGPTGSISSRLLDKDTLSLKAHLLATSIDETSPGSSQFPSPNARLKTTRWIPILEGNYSPNASLLIKESLFYDKSSLRFVDPDNQSNSTYDRTHQYGSETVALWSDWTFGFSIRRTQFAQIGGEPPRELIGHLQAERLIRLGAWTTQASAQADWMNLYGTRPGTSLGERYDISADWGIFGKANFSYRYPTLQDRYYQGQSFTANPDLTLERALSLNFGNQWKKGEVEGTEQIFLQFRANAQVIRYNPGTFAITVVNGGNARQVSYLDELTWHAATLFDITNSWRLSHSRIESTGARIPYDPILTEVLTGHFHPASDQPVWGAGTSLRAVTSSSDGLGGVNGGYAVADIESHYTFRKITPAGDLTVQGRIDNLLDRRIQVVQGYPWPGRLFSLSLIAGI